MTWFVIISALLNMALGYALATYLEQGRLPWQPHPLGLNIPLAKPAPRKPKPVKKKERAEPSPEAEKSAPPEEPVGDTDAQLPESPAQTEPEPAEQAAATPPPPSPPNEAEPLASQEAVSSEPANPEILAAEEPQPPAVEELVVKAELDPEEESKEKEFLDSLVKQGAEETENIEVEEPDEEVLSGIAAFQEQLNKLQSLKKPEEAAATQAKTPAESANPAPSDAISQDDVNKLIQSEGAEQTEVSEELAASIK